VGAGNDLSICSNRADLSQASGKTASKKIKGLKGNPVGQWNRWEVRDMERRLPSEKPTTVWTL